MARIATDWIATNRLNWDDRAAIHLRDETGFYSIDRVRAGEDVLDAIEAAEIGPLGGARLAHLQCHFGLDTLCLARRGADATGLDFSPVAIAAAQALAAELKLPARFVEAEVYAARERLQGDFDVVFVTWGAICWLPDIQRWARVVASLLAPGGRLYLADAHPCAMVLDQIDGRLQPAYRWRTAPDAPLVFDDPVSYTGDSAPLTNTRHYEWMHPLSEIVGGLLEAGLRLDFLHEHEVLPWPMFPMMVRTGDRLFRLPEGQVPLALSFSLQASRPGGSR